MNEQRLERFRAVAGSLTGTVHILVTQVDPDAFGAALGLQAALEHLRGDAITVKAWYCGAVGHPQTRVVVNRYNLSTRLLPIAEHEPADGDVYALVDSALVSDSRLPERLHGHVDPRIVIDHHRGPDIEEADDRFLWVEDIGAACTQVTELCFALGVELDPVVATMLTLGIYTDTRSLMGASSRDRHAWVAASEHASAEDLRRFIDYPLPDSHYQNLTMALQSYEQQGSKVIVSLGTVARENGDDLSTVADLFLRRDGVSLVVVWAIIENEVRLSARNSNLSEPLDAFLRTRFGDASGAKLTPDGKGEGGARLRLDLGLWMSDSTRPHIEAMVSARIREAIFPPRSTPSSSSSPTSSSDTQE